NSSTTDPSTTDTTLGAKIETTYATYISSSQPADTYTGQVKYTMVHPYTEQPLQPQTTEPGKICYYANASNAEGTMGCQGISASTTSAMLFASNFSRSGYGFAGWSDSFDYATNPQANLYGPNETISFAAGQYTDNNQGLSLYAVWIKSVGSFQDDSVVSRLCGSDSESLTLVNYNAETGELSANLSSVSALTDQRDNQTYAIAKLADGNCWMIENLRLDNTTELTTLNTNNPLNDNSQTNPTVTLKHNYADIQTYDTLSATSSVAYDPDTAPDGWCNESSASCNDQSRLRTDNTTNRAAYTTGQSMSNRAVNIYSYGNYYNWYSATAGRGVYEKNSSDAEGDICPRGWKLPYGNTGSSSGNKGGTSGGLSYLDKTMGGTGTSNSNNTITGKTMSSYWRQFPNNYVFSGYMSGASIDYRGTIGISWSSTPYGRSGAYTVFINVTGLRPGTLNSYDNDKDGGKTLRCVVKSGS
ncbi:hypothetical protein IJI28_00170, partial [Candidatus Saccharibacteria bacterium]|nr:hypothetical protein [Candidatus Saccharibacteria bacterium]